MKRAKASLQIFFSSSSILFQVNPFICLVSLQTTQQPSSQDLCGTHNNDPLSRKNGGRGMNEDITKLNCKVTKEMWHVGQTGEARDNLESQLLRDTTSPQHNSEPRATSSVLLKKPSQVTKPRALVVGRFQVKPKP